MKAFTIGPLAKKCGVNVETVRYYQRRGLLALPEAASSTYRRYSESDVERISFIKGAQGLGFTLNEIAELLALRVDSTNTAFEVKKRTTQKIASIERKIALLEEMKLALIQLDASCQGSEDSICPILDAFGKVASGESCCQESGS
ncbi:Transcriptional regulator, MerR family [hydrothermal vent metagenome]|uniref:Transcriptional regulator, MerR family n=1 Tax=hydrothermal vent metagenome TaxID=652676 RepID=A0A3B1CSB5_9ZZZZ